MCAHGGPLGLSNLSVMADKDQVEACRDLAKISGSQTYRVGCQSVADAGLSVFTDEFETSAAVPRISISSWIINPLNAGRNAEEFTQCASAWGVNS